MSSARHGTSQGPRFCRTRPALRLPMLIYAFFAEVSFRQGDDVKCHRCNEGNTGCCVTWLHVVLALCCLCQDMSIDAARSQRKMAPCTGQDRMMPEVAVIRLFWPRLIPLHAASIVFSLPGHIAFELGQLPGNWGTINAPPCLQHSPAQVKDTFSASRRSAAVSPWPGQFCNCS